jgi:hypothetical protein
MGIPGGEGGNGSGEPMAWMKGPGRLVEASHGMDQGKQRDCVQEPTAWIRGCLGMDQGTGRPVMGSLALAQGKARNGSWEDVEASSDHRKGSSKTGTSVSECNHVLQFVTL